MATRRNLGGCGALYYLMYRAPLTPGLDRVASLPYYLNRKDVFSMLLYNVFMVAALAVVAYGVWNIFRRFFK